MSGIAVGFNADLLDGKHLSELAAYLVGYGIQGPYFTSGVASNPQAPASWTDIGTPVVTGSQTDPWGGTAAILVEDNDGAAFEGKRTDCTFTGDGTKCVVFALRAGSVAAVRCKLRDTTAATDRHEVSVTWNSGLTAPTVATVAGSGTIFPSVPCYDHTGNLWWATRFTAASVVAANANQMHLYAGTSSPATGTFYLAGGNAWDFAPASPWVGPDLAA